MSINFIANVLTWIFPFIITVKRAIIHGLSCLRWVGMELLSFLRHGVTMVDSTTVSLLIAEHFENQHERDNKWNKGRHKNNTKTNIHSASISKAGRR